MRRPSRRYVSKRLQAEYDLSVLKHIRDHMQLACIAVCHAVKQKPTPSNLRQARYTIQRWARVMYAEWHNTNTLLECLKEVTHATCFIGLPVCEWKHFENGKYPAIRWPSERNERQQGIVLRAWNKEGVTQSVRLWQWYDRMTKEGV